MVRKVIKRHHSSPIKQKILLMLLGGYALGCSYTPGQQIRTIRAISRGWKQINKDKLSRIIREFYNDRLVDLIEEKDGSTTIILSELGKKRALRYKIDELKIPKQKWDGKWRVVVFDIPERQKQARSALRNKLRDLDFLNLQKSVWVCPYDCQGMIDFIVEFFEIRKYVRYMVVQSITNEAELKRHFGFY